MRDAKIITLYKNKGKRSDCNNYRGISLLSTAAKVFAVDMIAVDMIFSLHQLQEKCREQH